MTAVHLEELCEGADGTISIWKRFLLSSTVHEMSYLSLSFQSIGSSSEHAYRIDEYIHTDV